MWIVTVTDNSNSCVEASISRIWLLISRIILQDFYLVELESSQCVQKSLQHCHHRRESVAGASIPVYSPFLWFSGNGHSSSSGDLAGGGSLQTIPVYLPVHHEQLMDDTDVIDRV